MHADHLRSVYVVKEKDVQPYWPALPDDFLIEEARAETGSDVSPIGTNQRTPVCPHDFPRRSNRARRLPDRLSYHSSRKCKLLCWCVSCRYSKENGYAVLVFA